MHTPLGTYRIQFSPSFTFKDLIPFISYFQGLGISCIYASPVFKARRGSTHGYDIVDPHIINPELGGEDGFNQLITELQNKQISWIQDIVPNHMSFNGENRILMDVLEHGISSPFYDFFDINWEHPYESMHGRLLAPFLGKFYAEALESKELQLNYNQNGFSINYYSLAFPLYIPTYKKIFSYRLSELKEKIGAEHSDIKNLEGIFSNLNFSEGQTKQQRYDILNRGKESLWKLYSENKDIREFLDSNISIFNGVKDEPESFNLLDDLLANQTFRLSFWKVATEEINYRRFFNINELICMRVEKKEVFDYMHSLVLKLINEGKINGLRVDHIDGLYDPSLYIDWLRSAAEDSYIIVEKILLDKEKLFSRWPVQGTTGYDFLRYANGIFCLRKNQRKFNRIYAKFSGIKSSYQELQCNKKRLIIGKHMAGNIDNLATFMKMSSSHSRHGLDITLYGLKRALVEVLSLLPVYRTYISPGKLRPADKSCLVKTIARAKSMCPGLVYELNFIEKFLLLESKHVFLKYGKKQLLEFVMRFQQVSGPLMAKGVEDTLFYIYNRLLSLNEVGSIPGDFGVYLSGFHEFNKRRSKSWPQTLNTLSTHDTKRGEDIRARINVLSEMPDIWEKNLKNWHKLNKKFKKNLNSTFVPIKNDEYFLYQTVLGALPFKGEDYPVFLERLKRYLVKAVREAKVHTAWLKPDTDYENAFVEFTEKIFNFSNPNQFIEEFLPFQRKIAYYGIFNSLSQTLLKITAPGVADFYQGSELWDLNLVDPDNRRPVDFSLRQEILNDIRAKEKIDEEKLIQELLQHKEDGRIKLFLIYRALNARRTLGDVLKKGEYRNLDTGGKYKEHIIAFCRRAGERFSITVVPRFLSLFLEEGENPLRDIWQDTYLVWPEDNPQMWYNAITGEKLEGKKSILISDIFKNFPVGLLVNNELSKNE